MEDEEQEPTEEEPIYLYEMEYLPIYIIPEPIDHEEGE